MSDSLLDVLNDLSKASNSPSQSPVDSPPLDQSLIEVQEALHQLAQEEREITASMAQLLSPRQSYQTQMDLIEAYLTEIQIRHGEANRIMTRAFGIEQERTQRAAVLRKQIEQMERSLAEARSVSDRRTLRHKGRLPQQFSSASEELDGYDWIIDINLISDLSHSGWIMEFSERYWSTLDPEHREEMFKIADSGTDIDLNAAITKVEEPEAKGSSGDWEGAIVAVVGLYDKGKTFVLNNITESNLPSGKKMTTRGLSFKHVNMDSGTQLILLDTAGSYSPVKVVSEFSVSEKEASELFLLDLVFDLSDYFICVVNDFTSLDQRYLDKISRSLQNSSMKTFREVIVIHNLKEVETRDVLEYLWNTQVTQIYGSGKSQNTKVAAVNPVTGVLEEKQVTWFKTPYSRHVCLANADTQLGQELNSWVFSLLKYWLKAVFVPVNRPISVVESVMSIAKMKLISYFKVPLDLQVVDLETPLKRKITCVNSAALDKLRIPQVSTDSSGLIMSRPDSFLPLVDIVQSDQYAIYMDVPGLTKEDITVSRQNVVTVVQGKRKRLYSDTMEQHTVVKQERKGGDFTMTFRIPESFERKWSSYEVKDGVLLLKYERDVEDGEDGETKLKV